MTQFDIEYQTITNMFIVFVAEYLVMLMTFCSTEWFSSNLSEVLQNLPKPTSITLGGAPSW